MSTRKMMYREALYHAMVGEMKKNDLLFMIGYDIGKYGGEFRISNDMYSLFGAARVRDAPISEQAIAGLAIGAALTGCRAIAELPFADFMLMCADMIVNQAAKFRYTFAGQAKVPVVFLTAIGGYIRAAEQHSQCLEGWFMGVPGLKTVVPSTPYDARGLLTTALRDDNPIVFAGHKALYPMKGEVPEEEYAIPFGKADIKKKGSDITVVSYSYVLHKVLAVAQKLEKEGISVEVVDPRTLYPLDKDAILTSVRKTGRALVVHEAYLFGGPGGEIAATIADEAFDSLKAPVKRVGAKWTPIPFPSVLEDFVLPGEADIEQSIRELVRK
jgi:pyruvate/2-oxoglutarate/acetoin dehydrogenase E1 component